MTIDPTIGSSGAIGALSGIGQAASGASGIDGAVRSLATDIVGRIAGQLGLGGDAAAPLGHGDIYGLGALAEGIGQSLGDASAPAIGALTRSLEDFAGAVAADMAAHADGRTLDTVDAALGANPFAGASDVSGVIRGLDEATAGLSAARR